MKSTLAVILETPGAVNMPRVLGGGHVETPHPRSAAPGPAKTRQERSLLPPPRPRGSQPGALPHILLRSGELPAQLSLAPSSSHHLSQPCPQAPGPLSPSPKALTGEGKATWEVGQRGDGTERGPAPQPVPPRAPPRPPHLQAPGP